MACGRRGRTVVALAVFAAFTLSALAREVKTVRLTVVFDNNRVTSGTETGWGFSCWIDVAGVNLLFDTGSQGDVLLRNVHKLGLDPANLQEVVISHMHWDHTGGLKKLLAINPHLVVYLPSSATRGEVAELESSGASVHLIREAKEILPGVWTTGTLGGAIPEQALVLKTDEGLAVLTGCAHPGVVKILRTVKKMFPEERLNLVMGGFHLWSRRESEIKPIVDEFRQLGVEHPAPCHCSGDLARALFEAVYGDDYYPAGVGFRIEFHAARTQR